MKPVFGRTLAALCASASLLTACGGGGGGASLPSTPTQTQPNPASGLPPAVGQIMWGQSVLSQLPYLGPVKVGALSLVVSVHMRDAQGLVQYAQSASDPKSPNYRQWLTPQQIGDRFGASTSDYQAAEKYLSSYGLKVGGWPQREMLTVSGTIGQLSQAFNTSFGKYQFNGTTVVAPVSAPSVGAAPIAAISPMMNAPVQRSYFMRGIGNNSFFGYSPQQVGTGFDYSGAWANGITGSGINIGIIGTGPILNAAGGNDDTAAYAAFFKAPLATITQVNASPQPASTPNGGTGSGAVDPYPAGLAPAPPITQPCQQPTFPTPSNFTTCNPEDGEAQLDTQSIASLAPGSNVLFYMAYNPSICVNPTTGNFDGGSAGACPTPGDEKFPQEGLQLSDDEIQQAIADNKADAISMSFGGPENLNLAFGYISSNPASPGIGQIENASLAAEGIAVFISSGDDGAWECFDPASGAPLGIPCASYPATDPAVTAVGGVNIPLDAAGNLQGIIGAWADNTTLGGNGHFGNNVGSGGGVSSVFSAPSWQVATVGSSMREVPDMSLDADPNTGEAIFVDTAYGGSPGPSGGTSMSAPEAAAQWGLVLQACKASSTCNKGGTFGYRLGNAAPLYYAIYGTSTLAKGAYSAPGFTPGLTYENVFYDVLYGGNQAVPSPRSPAPISTPGGYNSGPGYDMVTGVGAPYTGHLIQAVTGTKLP